MSRTSSEIRNALENQDLSIDPDGLLDSPEEIEIAESDDDALERLKRKGTDRRDLPGGIDLPEPGC